MVPLIQLPGAFLLAGGALLALSVLLLGLLWRERRRRRRAERSTAEIQSQLQTVTATMREGVITYDMERRLTFVNPAFERLTEYPLDDLREQEFLQYIHHEDRPAILAEWDRLAQGGALRDQEYRVITRSGQIRWCSSSSLGTNAGRGGAPGRLHGDGVRYYRAQARRGGDAPGHRAVPGGARGGEGRIGGGPRLRHCHARHRRTEPGPHRCKRLGDRGDRRRGCRSPGAGRDGSTPAQDERQPFGYLRAHRRAPTLRRHSLGLSGSPSGIPELGIRSILVMPLQDEHRTLGMLKVVSPEAHAFTDRDAKALQLLGGLMGAALGHAAAFEGRQTRLEERTRALQESEQRFKQLVDVAQEGIWVADDRGLITYVNQRLADLLGYVKGSLLGRPVYDFIEPDARAGAQRILGRRVSPPGQSQDLCFRRRDGSQVWGLVSSSSILGKDGALVGTVGMVTDITERKRTEDQLRRSADRLAMLHDMDQAIVAAHSPAEVGRAALGRMRRMVSCQRCTVVLFDFDRGEAELIAGYSGGVQLAAGPLPMAEFSPAEVLQRGSVRYVEDLAAMEDPPPMLRQLLTEGLRSVLSSPLIVEGEVIGEINLAASAPAAFDVEHREIALEVATPLAIAIQHARLRQELSRQTGELERRLADRSASLRAATAEVETLLYSVSHDLRAPLRHLIGFSRMLLDDHGEDLDSGALHYAERIHQAADQMATLVDDLVGLSRIGRQDLLRREVGLTTLVEDVVDQLRSSSNGRVIDWKIEELPIVECDPGLAKIAITHLLANAVKFTRPRERATIRIHPVEADGQVGLCVEDNGVGFRMTYAGKLFGMFQRLHRPDEFEGNGAGLAIVQRIAHKHGGRVWAESEPDAGAKFCLTLGSAAANGGAGTPRADGLRGGTNGGTEE